MSMWTPNPDLDVSLNLMNVQEKTLRMTSAHVQSQKEDLKKLDRRLSGQMNQHNVLVSPDQKKLLAKMDSLHKRMEELDIKGPSRRSSDSTVKPNQGHRPSIGGSRHRKISEPARNILPAAAGAFSCHDEALAEESQSPVRLKRHFSDVGAHPTVRKLSTVERKLSSSSRISVTSQSSMGQLDVDDDDAVLDEEIEARLMEEDKHMKDIRRRMSEFVGHKAYEEKLPPIEQPRSQEPVPTNTIAVNYIKGRKKSLQQEHNQLNKWMGVSEQRPRKSSVSKKT